MQPTSRIKLNRNAFKTEGPGPKRRRFGSTSLLASDPIVDAMSDMNTERSEDAGSDPKNNTTEEPSPPLCTDAGQSEIQSASPETSQVQRGHDQSDTRPVSSAQERKQIRCHMRLALRFCGEKSAVSPHAGSAPSVSCTVSGYIGAKNDNSAEKCQISRPESDQGRRDAKGSPAQANKKVGRVAQPPPNCSRKAGLRRRCDSVRRLVSGKHCKRSVKNSCCALCGDIKYTPPACKKVAHKNKPRSRGPAHCKKPSSSLPGKQRKEKRAQVCPVVQTQQATKVLFWFGKYPMVKLCDVARVFDVSSSDFSCILPVVLLQKRKHKRVKCLKREFRSLMCPGDGSNEKWIVRQSWEVCSPTNSCASFSSGDQASGASVDERVLDTAENNKTHGGASDNHVIRIPDSQTIRLPSDEENSCVPSEFCSLNNRDEDACNAPSASEALDSGHHVRPLILRRVSDCDGVVLSQKEADTTHGQQDTDANESSDDEANLTDSFSCRRTSDYDAWSCFSCARTSRSWPFPRHGPPKEIITSVGSGPRWVVTSAVTEHEVSDKRNCVGTMEKSGGESSQVPEPNNHSLMARTDHEKINCAKQVKMPTNCFPQEKTLKDVSGFQKKSARAGLPVGDGLLWNVTLGVTKDVVTNMKTSITITSECTAGNNNVQRGSLQGLKPNNESTGAQNNQKMMQLPKRSEMNQDSPVPKKASKDQPECVKNPGNVLKSVHANIYLTSAGPHAIDYGAGNLPQCPFRTSKSTSEKIREMLKDLKLTDGIQSKKLKEAEANANSPSLQAPKVILENTKTFEQSVVDSASESSDEEASFPEFSCQRTTAFRTSPHSSCARTYRSWSFPRRGPPGELSSVRGGPHWVEISAATDDGVSTNSDHTKEGFKVLESRGRSTFVVQNSTVSEEASKDVTGYLKKPEKTLKSVCSESCKDVTSAKLRDTEQRVTTMETGPSRTSNCTIGKNLREGFTVPWLNDISTVNQNSLGQKLTAGISKIKPDSQLLQERRKYDTENNMNRSLKVLKLCNQRVVAQNYERPSEVSKGSTEFQNNQGSTFESVHVSLCGNVNSKDSGNMQICTSIASECPVGTDFCLNKIQSAEPKEIEAEADAQALEKTHKGLSEHPGQYSEGGCSDANKTLSPLEESERILQYKPHSLAAESVRTPIQSTQKDNSGHDAPSRIDGELKTIPAPESATVPHTHSVNVCSSSADWPSKTSISKHIYDTENKTGVTASNFEPQTLTMMTSSVVEPNSPTLLTHELEANSDVPDVEGSLDCLKTKTSDPKLTSERKWKCFDTSASEDLSSPSISSDEDDTSSLSYADQLEVDDPARDELGDIGKANSPHSAPKYSVFNGCDLDVMRAYEEDAIVLDVIQDDPDLFGGIDVEGTGSLNPKNRPVLVHRGKKKSFQTEKTPVRSHKIVWDLESQSSKKTVQTPDDLSPVNREDYGTGKENELAQDTESHLIHSRSWRPVKPIVNEQKCMDSNNNLVNKDTTDLNVNNTADRLVVDSRNQVRTMAGKDVSVVRPLPSSYCWYYFSEYCVCLRTACWFLHLPRDDDEQFCMNTVQKFCLNGNTPIVQRAVEVFVGYYRTNFPGVSFSQNIVNSLLSSLLSLALLGDLVSVITTLLSHKRTPHPEFVIALYKHVRERGFHSFVPELILLTSKIIEAGCVFSVEQCEIMQVQLRMLHVPRHHLEIFHAVKCRALAMNPQTAELSELAQALVQVEVFKQQEDWSGLARVFCTVCDGRHSAVELSRFCSCVTMALLKDPKDKLTLPYEPFAASVCQKVPSDGLVKSFLGRVGVSLMFNYHRTQDWSKGMKVVGVMSRLQIEFFTLKGFFSGEDEPSRCQLVTMAAELFLNSGSIEGALNMLRDNDWFVTSSVWPCDEGDMHNRRRVLIQLAGKTSHRDTLEVLTNLPGLSQSVDGVQPGEYSSVFNAHLQRCVTNQVLPVAADTLEFMLIHKIHVDTPELHHLIHKLGKQNVWSRARTLFKCAHSAGYYLAVVFEKDWLDLPCSLSEIEMTLAFEMFITRVGSVLQNPTDVSQPLLITLKRGSCSEGSMESAYLAAGCRLLSAALIPNPKLSIRYTAVNQEQEQLFHLDRGSAAKWLSHNRSWAQEMWP